MFFSIHRNLQPSPLSNFTTFSSLLTKPPLAVISHPLSTPHTRPELWGSGDLCILNISLTDHKKKWSVSMITLFHLIMFTIHPYCIIYSYFIYFYCQISHSMEIPHFVYSSVNGHLGVFYFLPIMSNFAMNTDTYFFT